MYGFGFDGHPSLRHLYLPSGFEGHPLRKDFPLLARVVKPWPGLVDVEPMPEGARPAAPEAVAAAEAPRRSNPVTRRRSRGVSTTELPRQPDRSRSTRARCATWPTRRSTSSSTPAT